MPCSRSLPLVKSSSFGEVGVQRMDSPVTILKKRQPAIAHVECIRPVVQEVRMIKNLDCKLMEDDEQQEEYSEGSGVTLELPIYNENKDYDDDQSVDCNFGVFLQNCSLCNKRILRHMDVFMYGFLKAFCSPECRDAQIERDERLRPPSPEPPQLKTIVKLLGASN